MADLNVGQHTFVPGRYTTHVCQAPDPWQLVERCGLTVSAPVHLPAAEPFPDPCLCRGADLPHYEGMAGCVAGVPDEQVRGG